MRNKWRTGKERIIEKVDVIGRQKLKKSVFLDWENGLLFMII